MLARFSPTAGRAFDPLLFAVAALTIFWLALSAATDWMGFNTLAHRVGAFAERETARALHAELDDDESTVTTLPDLVPDVDVLLALAPEELGRALMAAAAHLKDVRFQPGSVTSNRSLFGLTPRPDDKVYPRGREQEIALALGEGWQWLELNMFIMPAPGTHGNHGWKVFTRRGKSRLNGDAAFKVDAAPASR